MKKIIVLQHGETEWNKKEKFTGLADLPLTENGLQQSHYAAKTVASLKPHFIYSSPLKRALQTAEAVANITDLPVHKDTSLIDMDFGLWQGLSLTEAYNKYRKDYMMWLHNPQMLTFPQGESLLTVQERINGLLKFVEDNHKDDAVLFVTHKLVCIVLILTVIGADLRHFWQIKQDIAALNVFIERGGLLLAWKINDTCHIKLKVKS